MSAILCIYKSPPSFPATDQHPLAKRYTLDHPRAGTLIADVVDGPPAQTEIDVLLGLDANSQAAARAFASFDSSVATTTFGGKTIAEIKTFDAPDFDAWFDTNIVTAEQVRAVLKFVLRIIIRKVL